MARSIECRCAHDFTCGYCLRNAPPWFYTLSDGSAIYDVPFQGRRHTQVKLNDEVGEILTPSMLTINTVVCVRRQGGNTLVTAWVKEVTDKAVWLQANALPAQINLILFREGEELRDDTGPMEIREYLGAV